MTLHEHPPLEPPVVTTTPSRSPPSITIKRSNRRIGTLYTHPLTQRYTHSKDSYHHYHTLTEHTLIATITAPHFTTLTSTHCLIIIATP
ncbi:hypothetical protein E2C01_086234 [Portunus trituberculatus]|uniref:Uncharacterized protein n=1 Tax=Portunus trituberculatus TaxID=210409 RepID=A0A5B7J9R2_PORTR|nr:hypothetical protein [Portunus trituberculatus]